MVDLCCWDIGYWMLDSGYCIFKNTVASSTIENPCIILNTILDLKLITDFILTFATMQFSVHHRLGAVDWHQGSLPLWDDVFPCVSARQRRESPGDVRELRMGCIMQVTKHKGQLWTGAGFIGQVVETKCYGCYWTRHHQGNSFFSAREKPNWLDLVVNVYEVVVTWPYFTGFVWCLFLPS